MCLLREKFWRLLQEASLPIQPKSDRPKDIILVDMTSTSVLTEACGVLDLKNGMHHDGWLDRKCK